MRRDQSDPVATIGREAELETVDQFLRSLPGGLSAFLLHGEPGIGKTTLWNQAVALAGRLGFTVLSCRPTQAESELPYMGLGDLLAFVPYSVLATLPGPQRRSLEIALLRAEADGSPLQQRAVAVAVLNVLRETSRPTPVLVAIDDAQWLDAPTRRVLRFALRRLADAPIGLLVATRAGVKDEDVLALEGIGPPDRIHHHTVRPLAPAALDRLLRSRARAPIAGHVLRRVTEASGGNPLFALELVRALADSPDTAEPGRPLAVPASLTEVLGSRLARLPTSTRDCLLVAAALSRPTVDLIQRAQARSADVTGALIAGVDAGVIELHRGAVRFVHPLLAGVLYAQAASGELRQLHRRLAGVVQDPEERARHLGLSAVTADEAVAAAIEEGALRAARRAAPDVAAALFEQAARVTPPESAEAAARRIVDAADQHIALRESARAQVLLEEVLSYTPSGAVRARALHRLARIHAYDTGFDTAPRHLLEALEHVGKDIALEVAIERDLTFAGVQLGDLKTAVAHARSCYQAAVESDRAELLAEALDQLCMAEVAAGNAVTADLLERAIEVDEVVGPTPLGEHPGWGTGRLLLALALKWSDRLDVARGLLRSLLVAFADRGDEGSVDTTLFHLGELELWAGNWQVACELSIAATDVQVRSGQPVVERRAELLSAMVDEARGNLEAARATAMRYFELSEGSVDPPGKIRCLRVLGRLELSSRRPVEAAEHFLRGAAIEAASGFDPAIGRIQPEAIEALIDAGRLSEASARLQSFESYAERLERAWGLATAARCRGLFEAANGDLGGAQIALERSVDLCRQLGQPLEHARALLALGIVQRRLKKKREARETLDRALSTFEALGAQTWSRATRAEQSRIGGRSPSPHELTPTEARIAQLVAEGLTNREVAASVYLSEKTIETNLTRIYEKLAVGSRRELTRKFRSEVPLA